MPNFFCGSLVVVRCGPQGLSALFDRPGARTAAVAAGYSYLLVSKGSAKTIRMSLSREQPPARVERAQQEQDYAASRSGHAGCRLFFLRCKRECGGLKPLPGAMPGFSANKRTRDVRPCSHVRVLASFPGRKDGIAANDSGPMPCPSDPADETAPAADQIEKASNPPSTTASAPVTNDEASLTR